MPVVELDRIHKSFGEVEVLKGVSLVAHEGEVVVLIGSSGSGKSTLLRCINMLEIPDSGTVRIAGSPTKPRSAASVPASAWCSNSSTCGAI
jgi:ABC-type histidine transport system ATPase subunit